jgi:DNA-binding MarR family transcriptional regulator
MQIMAAEKKVRDVNISIGEALEQLLAATHKLEFAVSNLDAFGDIELSFADFFALRTLSAGGEMRMAQFALKMRLSRQRLNKIVKQLEKQGYIAVKGVEEDARARLVSITKAGETVLEEMRKKLHLFADKLGAPTPKVPSVLNAAGVAARLSAAAWKNRVKGGKAVKEAE